MAKLTFARADRCWDFKRTPLYPNTTISTLSAARSTPNLHSACAPVSPLGDVQASPTMVFQLGPCCASSHFARDGSGGTFGCLAHKKILAVGAGSNCASRFALSLTVFQRPGQLLGPGVVAVLDELGLGGVAKPMHREHCHHGAICRVCLALQVDQSAFEAFWLHVFPPAFRSG